MLYLLANGLPPVGAGAGAGIGRVAARRAHRPIDLRRILRGDGSGGN